MPEAAVPQDGEPRPTSRGSVGRQGRPRRREQLLADLHATEAAQRRLRCRRQDRRQISVRRSLVGRYAGPQLRRLAQHARLLGVGRDLLGEDRLPAATSAGPDPPGHPRSSAGRPRPPRRGPGRDRSSRSAHARCSLVARAWRKGVPLRPPGAARAGTRRCRARRTRTPPETAPATPMSKSSGVRSTTAARSSRRMSTSATAAASTTDRASVSNRLTRCPRSRSASWSRSLAPEATSSSTRSGTPPEISRIRSMSAASAGPARPAPAPVRPRPLAQSAQLDARGPAQAAQLGDELAHVVVRRVVGADREHHRQPLVRAGCGPGGRARRDSTGRPSARPPAPAARAGRQRLRSSSPAVAACTCAALRATVSRRRRSGELGKQAAYVGETAAGDLFEPCDAQHPTQVADRIQQRARGVRRGCRPRCSGPAGRTRPRDGARRRARSPGGSCRCRPHRAPARRRARHRPLTSPAVAAPPGEPLARPCASPCLHAGTAAGRGERPGRGRPRRRRQHRRSRRGRRVRGSVEA